MYLKAVLQCAAVEEVEPGGWSGWVQLAHDEKVFEAQEAEAALGEAAEGDEDDDADAQVVIY